MLYHSESKHNINVRNNISLALVYIFLCSYAIVTKYLKTMHRKYERIYTDAVNHTNNKRQPNV